MGFVSGFFDALRRLFSGDDDMVDTAGAHRLYVGNLSYKVKDEELRSLFAKYGKVKTLHLIRDRLTRRLKGYAFLEMSPEDAAKALALNGTDFLGRKLVVSIAKQKRMGGSQGPGQGQSRRPNRWQKKRRNGPRAYGPAAKENTPVQRLE